MKRRDPSGKGPVPNLDAANLDATSLDLDDRDHEGHAA
jgi:hypothetical protein